VETLLAIDTITKGAGMGLIHLESGLGFLQIKDETLQPQPLIAIRQLCQKQDGFLSLLNAAIALKQQVDVWGYTGNALDLMRAIKNQFDPNQIFSPNRSVGGL
jgi:glycolate oxidase FAD binding subunit